MRDGYMQIEKITKPAQTIVSMSTHISHEHLPDYIGTSFMDLLEYIQNTELSSWEHRLFPT